VAGAWGAPEAALRRALDALQAAGLVLLSVSSLYKTDPVGMRRQPRFVNAVAGFKGAMAPAALLRLAKSLERLAGRRPGRRFGPRPLDIDILDYGGRRIGHPGRQRLAGRLLLPHPEMARRGFVLVPLAEMGACWRHARLGVGARQLLCRDRALLRGIQKCGPIR
jgi:2-amino-4-hydroxy-6-hydroxymethyldihydropteridine diphosphokinase